ncbi:MAPEG family protein [Tropicimonas sp. IMCC6043]|uniref:MAPEG family protein n=1 Tax=Tropicimonas sp. IMCC6043 TaxID=2510645 RepID=UPI00101BEBCB|nr:MAPEG family protein [Tropicimonas sp. IMCC6043]RYH11851.1 hypothetical protein EU800_04260 [Tropicimonas sp. IMCC6043]
MLVITPVYAGLLSLLLIGLSARVIRHRYAARISVGDGGDPEMQRRMRAQANCAEYAPIGIILLAMAEIQGMPAWLVTLFGAMLLLGRILHAWGFCATPQVMSARRWGMILTFGMIGMLALANIGHALS